MNQNGNEICFSKNGNGNEMCSQSGAGSRGAFVKISRQQQAEIDAEYVMEEEGVNCDSFTTQNRTQVFRNILPQSIRLYRETLRCAANSHSNTEISQWSSDEATIRLNRIEQVWTRFEADWSMLGQQQQLSEEQLTDCTVYLAEAEEDYLSYKLKLRRQIPSTGSVTEAGTSLGSPFGATPIQIQISEPARIPKFSGLESDWANFRAIFEADVHNQLKFSSAQKMRYLLGALQGRAEQIYKNWPIGDGSTYNQLWTELCTQYGNEYNTIRAHLQILSGLKPLQRPTCDTMRKMLDSARNAFRQLQLLLSSDAVAEHMLIYQLEKLLDSESHLQWSVHRSSEELPTLTGMFRFLELRSSVLSQSTETSFSCNTPSTAGDNQADSGAASSLGYRSVGRVKEPLPNCDLCIGQRHWPYHCAKFKGLSLSDRLNYITKHFRCINCFSSRHQSAKCPEKQCPRCKVKHNSVLCPKNLAVGSPVETLNGLQREVNGKGGRREDNTSNHSAVKKSKEEETWSALLATAIVRIEFNGCVSPPLRALCDTGAQINCISDNIVRKLKWPTEQCRVRIHGINGTSEKPNTRKLTCQLLARGSDTTIATIDLMAGPNLSKLWLPDRRIPEDLIPPEVIPNLADPGACVPAEIDILLGASVWALVIRDGSILSPRGIAFQPSTLGWLMYGGGARTYSGLTKVIGVIETIEPQLDHLLRRFWETEEIEVKRTRTAEHERCEDIFMKNHRRLPGGRFQVDIPLREDIDKLGSSRAMALNRFHQLERRFKRDPTLKEKYFAAINELLCAGQMQLADRPPNQLCYYIPHHPVLKKFRIVNDASCKTDHGISLNEMQLVGEKLQDNLADLIMRFRCHPVAITADIKKMYLQVHINPTQWDLQRIFWRPDVNTAIREYWLTVVTFGMASAPHCAVRAMIQGAREACVQYPIGSKAIEHDFYMDDCLSGAETDAEAHQLSEEMDAVLRSSGFVLDKWRSNRPNVVPTIVQEALDLSEFEDTTVLGLRWLPTSDELMFKFQPQPLLGIKESTKRRLLSRIAQIFDPNGYLGPIVVKAKILMQKIWSANIGWDSLVPDAIYREWQRFEQQLQRVTEIRLPRWLGISRERNISLHGFSDASTLAYGAALYIRVETMEKVECTLIAAKSRVAPLKTITIPRLELCAALMLSELLHTFKTTAKLPHVKSTLWSDSQIVLAWLKKDSATLKIFVNNRIQKIHQVTADADWRYISSSENPADQLSRGASADELREAKLWWNGPSWLCQTAIHWPNYQTKATSVMNLEISKEERCFDNAAHFRQYHKKLAAMSVILRGVNLLERVSKLFELCRLTAWIFRFLHNVRVQPENRWNGPLLNEEIKTAQEFWVREEQCLYYAKEIRSLEDAHSRGVDPSSPIANCTPWLDKKGLLRLGGRLGRALIPMQQKYPMLLPDVSPLAKLIIKEVHEVSMHGGPNETIAFVRRRFWITNLRRSVRKHNWNCVVCTRYRHQATTQMMSELPADRVTPCRAFSHSGVDYAGPYMLKARGGRCKIIEKKYAAVFVCMVTKAVHLELVESLSTADFIQAFLRFTSIRGACARLWSDNGKNFEGAAVELKKMLRSWNEMDMAKALQQYGTEWRFITPSAPHQGGLWEACVKSMKYHLRRVIGPHKLTSSEFQTVLAQTSAVMNSRPLSALTEDPEDLSFLTPAHFLIGEPIIQLFGANVANIPDNRLKSVQKIQKMSQVFWKAWAQDYLHQLQQRTKWRQPQPNLKSGDLVIIREENIPPTFWKTARVIKTFAGADSLVRNAQLRVASSDWKVKPAEKKVPFIILERPIQKLFRLPVEMESEAEHSRGECVAASGNKRVYAVVCDNKLGPINKDLPRKRARLF